MVGCSDLRFIINSSGIFIIGLLFWNKLSQKLHLIWEITKIKI